MSSARSPRSSRRSNSSAVFEQLKASRNRAEQEAQKSRLTRTQEGRNEIRPRNVAPPDKPHAGRRQQHVYRDPSQTLFGCDLRSLLKSRSDFSSGHVPKDRERNHKDPLRPVNVKKTGADATKQRYRKVDQRKKCRGWTGARHIIAPCRYLP